MASREIMELQPELQLKYWEFDRKMKSAGIKYIVTCTSRSILEQMALYAQGRMDLKSINRFRAVAGLPPFRSNDSGWKRKVTWTLKSKHITNSFDEDFDNDFSAAFDIAIIKGRKASWDIKVDVNENDVPDYLEVGRIAESVGLTWGGRWKTPDYVHIQSKRG